MDLRRGTVRSVAVAMIGLFIAASGAIAGTTTVSSRDHERIPACEDIDKVVANAGVKTTTFTITLAGRAKAAPCNGYPPSLVLNERCSTSGTAGHVSMSCEGGGGGAVAARINPQYSHVWWLRFPTKEATRPGTKAFKFSVTIGAADQLGPATVRIG